MSKTDDILAAVDEVSEQNRLLADRQPQARGSSHPRFDFRTEREDAARTWGELTNGRTQEHAEAIGSGPDQKMLAALDRLRTKIASLPTEAAFASLRSRADRVFEARAYQPVTLSIEESREFGRKLGRPNDTLAVLLCPRPIDPQTIAELRADILAAIGGANAKQEPDRLHIQTDPPLVTLDSTPYPLTSEEQAWFLKYLHDARRAWVNQGGMQSPFAIGRPGKLLKRLPAELQAIVDAPGTRIGWRLKIV